MIYAYTRPRYQVSVYRTSGPLVVFVVPGPGIRRAFIGPFFLWFKFVYPVKLPVSAVKHRCCVDRSTKLIKEIVEKRQQRQKQNTTTQNMWLHVFQKPK